MAPAEGPVSQPIELQGLAGVVLNGANGSMSKWRIAVRLGAASTDLPMAVAGVEGPMGRVMADCSSRREAALASGHGCV